MNELRNILVPVDFSHISENALKYAIAFACRQEVEKVYILHAYHIPSPINYAVYPYDHLLTDEVLNVENLKLEVLQEFQPFVLKSLQDATIPYEIVIEYGITAEVIQKLVEKHAIDLVMMGTRSQSPLDKFLGSTTVDTMTQCQCPVMAIPQESNFRPIQHILFAADYKKVKNPHIYQTLAWLSESLQAEVEILHVETEQEPKQEKLPEESLIDQTLSKLPHHFRYLQAKQVTQGIQEALSQYPADLIAMMPRQHSFFSRLRRGSQTQYMLRHTQLPLFTFHE